MKRFNHPAQGLDATGDGAIYRRLALQTLFQADKPGDRLVLGDETLWRALDRSRPLFASEWQALLDSPVTLRRMQVLANCRARQLARDVGFDQGLDMGDGAGDPQGLNPGPGAANDTVFMASRGVLRAAASDDPAPTLTSEDGRWRLHFLRKAQGWQMVLRLNGEATDANPWIEAKPTLGVLDGEGNTLLLGELDSDGELEGPWIQTETPYAYFAARGGHWEVVPA